MKKISLFILLIAFIASCSKTVESEKKNWESNVKKIKELKLDFPTFKSAFDMQSEAAEKIMKSSSDITDEEKKIEKMAAANKMLMSGFVRDLGYVKSKKKEIRKKIRTIEEIKMEQNDKNAARMAVEDAMNSMKRADIFIRTGANSTQQAIVVASKAKKELSEAVRDLAKVITKNKNKNSAKETAKKKVDEKNNAKKKEEVKSIKCEYCGTYNEAKATQCKSCGAPIKKK